MYEREREREGRRRRERWKGPNEKKIAKERGPKERTWLSLHLLSPSKPEVQAQVRVCRSFFVSTKSAAPYLLLGCLYLSLSFLRFLFHSLAAFMCLSQHSISTVYPLSHLFYSPPIIPDIHLSPAFEVKVRQYADLIPGVRVSSEALPGDSRTAEETATDLYP